MKIYTSLGLYANGSYKINGVSEENILEHIQYNLFFRGGRALIIDGIVLNKGQVDNNTLVELLNEISENNEKFKQNKDTQPYN